MAAFVGLTQWIPHSADFCEVRHQPWQKQHFSADISCYLLASLPGVYRPRKWISCWENGPQCDDHWRNLSQSDQYTMAYFLLIEHWARRCCVAALYWIGLNGHPAKEREAIVCISNISVDVWHCKSPHYFICHTSLVSERGISGHNAFFLSCINRGRVIKKQQQHSRQ